MVKTFRQFLEQKRLTEAPVAPAQLRGVVNAITGGQPATANNLTQLAAATSKADPGYAVAVASDPATEKARAIVDAQRKKLQPNQTQPNVSPNMLGAIPGTQ